MATEDRVQEDLRVSQLFQSTATATRAETTKETILLSSPSTAGTLLKKLMTERNVFLLQLQMSKVRLLERFPC